MGSAIDVVFAGAGHTALVALDELAGAPPGARLTLVSPGGTAQYSGLVPGWIEGLYPDGAMSIPLAPFACRVGAEYVEGTITAIADGAVRLAGGAAVPFDVLVLNTGAGTRRPDALADPRVIPAKPLGALMARIGPALDTAASFAVVGAGAAGVEIALALKARRPAAAVTLIERGDALLPGFPAGFVRRAARALSRREVAVVLGTGVDAVTTRTVRLDDGSEVAAECVVAPTGAAPPDWLEQTGLARAEDGFVAVDAAMRSLSHPNVLAAGDVATRVGDPRPKAGVFAVRAGPPIAAAVRALVRGDAPVPVRLQRRGLVLLSAGGRCAIGVRNGISAEGRWVWRLKDHLDRSFVARFAG